MVEKAHRTAAADSPKSAARFVRRLADRISAGSAGFSRHRAEYEALIEWAHQHQRWMPFSFLEEFAFIGEGAEHRVYKNDLDRACAIKATHPNRFGHSITREST